MAAGQGGTMPVGTPLSDANLALVRKWIADGASDVCTGPLDTGPAGDFHPEGWAASDVHGLAAKMQDQACVACHGDDLTGVGAAVSCDSCHAEGWRTNCTFCHGDPVDGSGAPPRHISGLDDGALASFLPHRAHTDGGNLAAPLDCAQCHTKPADVLSLGHLFLGDTTPGVAEAKFSGGLSPAGVFTASSNTCSNLYCHGTGRGNTGMVVDTLDALTCHSCHADASTPDRWRAMSGEHERHLDEGLACAECHAGTTTNGTSIADVSVHVNGTKDVVFAGTVVRNAAGRCSGACHTEIHVLSTW